MRRNKYFVVVLGILALFFLTGCQPKTLHTPSPIANGQTHQPQTPTVAVIIPSLTQGKTLTPTLKVASTSIATPTKTPTLVPSVTSTATLAPQRILTTQEAQATVDSLLITNTGCTLPCWWGIVPGQTSWNDALEMLRPLLYEQPRLHERSDGALYAHLSLHASRETLGTDKNSFLYISNDITVKNGIVEILEVGPGYVPTYQWSAILKEYGMPGEVVISTLRSSFQGSLPFDLVAYYPERGFLAEYSIYQASETTDGHIRACFQDQPAHVLALGVARPTMKLTEFAETRHRYMTTDFPYHSLEEATGKSIEEFYQQFQDTGMFCVETPAELWPIR